jgi:chromate transporter
VWLAIWLVPVALLALLLPASHVLVREAVFFSKTAVVTFGGAYAVLAYVAQQAVDVHMWLAPGEMLDGLGMAETTPGPLIQVVQFVGFMGAYRNAGAVDPLLMAVLGSVVTTWVTFAPCFLFVLTGAPFMEQLARRPRLRAALDGITAGVLGAVLNLAVWFAIHTLFAETMHVTAGPLDLDAPVWWSYDIGAVVIAVVAIVAAVRWKPSMFALLGFGVLAGVLLRM